MTGHKKDYLVGGILILMGIGAVILSMQIKVKTGGTDPGSRLFPMMASIVLILCGIGVVLSAAKSEEKPFLDKNGWKRMGICLGVLILYVLCLKYIGFLISTPVFLFVIVGLLSEGKKVPLWSRVVYSLIISGLIWYVFVKILSMPLPKGILL